MRRAGQNTKFVVSNAFSRALRCPVPVGAGSGSKKDGGDHLIHKTHNILPGLAVRSSRNLPRKAARVRMTSPDERFGTEGSIPSLGTTAVMRTTAQRQEFFIRREVAYLP